MNPFIQILVYLFMVNPTMTPPVMVPVPVEQSFGPVYQNVTSQNTLAAYSQADQRKFVERAYGEAQADGHEAISMVIGTMICRQEQGYGTADQLLTAYYAPDVAVSDETILTYAHSQCAGYKYALSTSDTVYLGIPASEPRHTVGDTHFFVRWASDK